MIVTVTRPTRPYADLTDLTAKAITERGWRQVDGDEVYLVRFAVNLTAAEDAAIRRRLTTSGQVEEDLSSRAVVAYADLQAFEALDSPTSPQVVAAVKLLCKVARALIRLQLRQLDATD